MLKLNRFRVHLLQHVVKKWKTGKEGQIASTHPLLLDISKHLWAQGIKLVVDTRAAFSVIPKEYLNNTVTYPTNISLVSVTNVKYIA